jgi:hypothetical protein
MTYQEIQNLFNSKTIKQGKFYKITYITTDQASGYSKTTTTKTRFVNYYNIKSVKASGKTPMVKPYETTIIPHILTYNTNKGDYYLHCYIAPNTKSKCVYKDNNGNEIDKATYQAMVKPSQYKPTIVFTKKVQDIISIG